MTYELKEPFWIALYQWQTLIAGLLALLAGIGTVVATINAAKREISAAQEQTRVAQEQIATTLRIERRRSAQERWAFYATLEAAMQIVITDVAAARSIASGGSDDRAASLQAYEARQRITKSMFPELRAQLLHLGGPIAAPLVGLDNKIDIFAAQSVPVQTSGGILLRHGRHMRLSQELDEIETEAKSIHSKARAAATNASDELAATAP